MPTPENQSIQPFDKALLGLAAANNTEDVFAFLLSKYAANQGNPFEAESTFDISQHPVALDLLAQRTTALSARELMKARYDLAIYIATPGYGPYFDERTDLKMLMALDGLHSDMAESPDIDTDHELRYALGLPPITWQKDIAVLLEKAEHVIKGSSRLPVFVPVTTTVLRTLHLDQFKKAHPKPKSKIKGEHRQGLMKLQPSALTVQSIKLRNTRLIEAFYFPTGSIPVQATYLLPH